MYIYDYPCVTMRTQGGRFMKIYPTTNTNFCGVKYLSIPPKITENLGSIEELANTSSLDLVVRHVPAQIPRPKFQMYTMDVTFLPKKTAKKGSSHSSFFII